MKAPNIAEHAGWVGAFTREQAPEAKYKNGARIEKWVSEAGDAHPLGSQGTVLGSVYVPPTREKRPPGPHTVWGAAYFVAWDDEPRTACFVVEWKLAPAPGSA